MSGLFGSVTIKGNRLTDFAQTTATVGIPLPFGYGIVPFDGNVTWAALPPKEHVSKKRQGKGGTKTETYTYTLSYMVSFCQGAIFGFWWIKRNGKVVWTQDPNAPIEDQAYAAKWAQRVQFYFGTETQLPDSTIESYEGTGNVSAHRGVAGFVVEDDDVTDGSGAVPTYEACCMCTPPEAYLTSKPYAQSFEDVVESAAAMGSASLVQLLVDADAGADSSAYSIIPTSGTLGSILFDADQPPDGSSYSVIPTGGVLGLALTTTDQKKDGGSYSVIPTGGALGDIPVGTQKPDGSAYSIIPTGGSLYT